MADRMLALDQYRAIGRRDSYLFPLLGVLLCLASIYQFPFIEEYRWLKYALHLFEGMCFFLLYQITRNIAASRRWTAVFIVAVIVRLLYGWLISYLQYQNDILGSFQEARFGLMIVCCPLVYYLFINASYRNLKQFCLWFFLTLAFVDLYVYVIYVQSGYLALGSRSASRFMLSVGAPIVILFGMLVISEMQGRKPGYLALGLILICAAHVVLITTSRVELLLTIGLLCFWSICWRPALQFPFFVIGGLIFLKGILLALDGDLSNIAGRDYYRALRYAIDSFPFGMGLVPEAIQKMQLGRASNFYASDYGLILFAYRYGAAGILMALGLLGIWAFSFWKILRLPGAVFFLAAVLVNLLFIPVLDYGSLNGSFLLAGIFAVARAMSARKSSAAGNAKGAAGVRRRFEGPVREPTARDGVFQA